MHRLACSLFRRYGTDPDGSAAVRGALQQVLDNTDMRGFSEHEITSTIGSARRFIAGQEQQEREAWEALGVAR